MVFDSRHPLPQPGHLPAQGAPIGVLALQGAFREHAELLSRLGADSRLVRTPEDLTACEGLVIPGGESTTIRKLLHTSGLHGPLRERLEAGMPALGTCAGMIVLASAGDDGAPPAYGLLDVDVARNGYGRQPFSFEAQVELGQAMVQGVFIRAPRIVDTGPQVEVIGRLHAGMSAGEAVAVRQGALLACTFHPELVGEPALHGRLASLVAARMGG